MTYAEQFQCYLEAEGIEPLFFIGETLNTLSELPASSIDFCMTSPPYWGHREYHSGGIGEEKSYTEFIQSLLTVFQEVHRVLKPSGSFWLNIGDTYQDKILPAIPWRLAIAMMDQQGWILRNGVIWNKLKGGLDQLTDKL